MSHLDEELARAAADEHEPVALGPRSTHKPSARPEPKRNLGLLVGLLAVGGALVALVMSFQEAAVYAKTVDQLMAEQTRFAGRPVRVEGDLVKGSLVHQDSPCEYRFRMVSKGVEVPVRYGQCVVPDTFRDVPDMDVKVTVEGKLAGGQFEATQVMAKCPSKYDMREKSKNGEAAPHAVAPAGAPADGAAVR